MISSYQSNQGVGFLVNTMFLTILLLRGAESFNWDNIYVIPDQYSFYLDMAVGSHIRYGLPVGEEFVSPKKRQYYGHPALYDLETGKTVKNICDARKRGLKKTYEMNQLRIKNIETGVFDFKNYNISHNFSIECGENKEKSIDSPYFLLHHFFPRDLILDYSLKNKILAEGFFRRSIGAGMGL